MLKNSQLKDFVKKSKKAFTLLELMVVVCLCTLLAGLAMIQLSFLDFTIARSEIDKLITVCTYMQQLACSTNKEQFLVFDIPNNSYTFNGHTEKLSKQLCFGYLPGIKGPPASPTHNITKTITFAQQRICFYPSGILSSGTIYIKDKSNRSLFALSNAVSQVSFLRIYKYNGTWILYDN